MNRIEQKWMYQGIYKLCPFAEYQHSTDSLAKHSSVFLICFPVEMTCATRSQYQNDYCELCLLIPDFYTRTQRCQYMNRIDPKCIYQRVNSRIGICIGDRNH